MVARNLSSEVQPEDVAGALMVARMRLVLALSAWLAVFVDAPDMGRVDKAIWLVLIGYMIHSAAMYAGAASGAGFAATTLVHRLDLVWYTLMVLLTGGFQSPLFPFFFFAILTSSFRWGVDEGARVTLVSTVLYTACSLGTAQTQDLPRLLMRAAFVLVLGHMCVHWGGSQLALRRQLALLREVGRVSNPRFGVDPMIVEVLERTRAFFDARLCLLVMEQPDSTVFSLRIVKAGEAAASAPQFLAAEAAAPWVALPDDHVAVYHRVPWCLRTLRESWAVHDLAQDRWIEADAQIGQRLAEQLEARAFISAPLRCMGGRGRLYVVAQRGNLRRADALFLAQIAAQAFPTIENIQLLDRMASEAASTERRKIALDLHDTAIQPYIGLQLALSAVRHKATPDNPLNEELDRLIAMAQSVIEDLRRYTGTVKSPAVPAQQVLTTALRQQAQKIRECYGIEVSIEIQGTFQLNDRLAVEVLHIVREGLSNVLKHTDAQKGAVQLQCHQRRLQIAICNEDHGGPVQTFTPRSIAERAAVLGGRAYVERAAAGTAVHVEIPL